MHRIVGPRQTRLLDPYGPVLTDINRRWLEESWPGVFRHVILELMPVEALRQHFHPTLGRPTRALYSLAGLLLLREFFHWTEEQAIWAYGFHEEVQYASNLEPVDMTGTIAANLVFNLLDTADAESLAASIASLSRRT